jgi:folate-binding protein YgfZ
MLTQDVASLPVRQARYACLLTPRGGRILGDLLVVNGGDHLGLDLEGPARDAVLPALERTVIMDDVTFTATPLRRAALIGPRAAAVLEAVGLPVPGPLCVAHRADGPGPVAVMRHDLGATPSFELLLGPAVAVPVLDALVERGDAARVGERALDDQRVRQGVPAYGRELDERTMPLEAGLGDTAISWTKGCYPGQEPVVMAKHRGRPANVLVRLGLDGEGALVVDQTVHDEGRAVGRVTTPSLDARRALAFVRTAHATPGVVLQAEDGAVVTVEGPTGSD